MLYNVDCRFMIRIHSRAMNGKAAIHSARRQCMQPQVITDTSVDWANERKL